MFDSSAPGLCKVDVLKGKWQNLRNQYAREKKETKLPTGSAATGSDGTWRYYQNLQFLAASYSSRPCVSNIPAAVEVVEEDSPQDIAGQFCDADNDNHQQPSTSRGPASRNIDKQIRDLIELENRKISTIEEIKKILY
ncbi:uncharacterized protein LOC125769694 [Anopheles funestus]|uniref:uncharacterized protein LOC125769694 n=1 Tax=Anopheles funestus TaxID=62324 RepID=UPI0020C5CB69|nr:uncharacterized protein LOC125769694 [Anopheles funestus]